jgi:hypothetical protein
VSPDPEQAGKGSFTEMPPFLTGGYNDGVKIYVALNKDGGWLDRHDCRRHITDTDWWLKPKTTTFREASAGDLFFVKRKHPNNELFTCARLKRDWAEEAPETAWQYTSEAYSVDSTYRQRAARVLKIPVNQVNRGSKIGLIALEELIWFPAEQRPLLDIKKNMQTGKKYTVDRRSAHRPLLRGVARTEAFHKSAAAGGRESRNGGRLPALPG